MPRLERHLNPAVRETLAEAAEIARAEEDYWQAEIERVMPEVFAVEGALKLPTLIKLPLALQRRIVRAAGRRMGLHLEFRHVDEVLSLVRERSHQSVALPDDWLVVRSGSLLRFQSRRHKQIGSQL